MRTGASTFAHHAPFFVVGAVVASFVAGPGVLIAAGFGMFIFLTFCNRLDATDIAAENHDKRKERTSKKRNKR